MVKRSSSNGPLERKIAHALAHGSATITGQQVVEYIQAFKSQYPDSDIELDHKVQKLVERIETKLALQAKTVREASQASVKS